jgi:hypothetical protein
MHDARRGIRNGSSRGSRIASFPQRQASIRPYVQKVRVPARVAEPGREPRDGAFLLFPSLGAERPSETLIELLNSSRVVVPFIPADDADVVLLTRAHIDWVIVGRDVDRGLVFPPDYVVSREQRVDLRLMDETHVHAVLQWHSPDGLTRLSDYLNGGDEFIPARTAFGTLLVNKLRVRETNLEESTDRPAAPGEPGVLAP